MKWKLIVYASLLIITGNACKKDDNSLGTRYQKSYNAWIKFKTSCNNSYRYVATYTNWIGTHPEYTETEMIIHDGIVTERGYLYKVPKNDGSGRYDTTQNWRETGAQVGSHDLIYKPWTLDQVYEEAKTNWLVEQQYSTNILETDHDGMISRCGRIYDRCPDINCFSGINIKEISPL